MTKDRAFPEITSADGLEKEPEVLQSILEGLPYLSSTPDAFSLDDVMVVDKVSLTDALKAACNVGKVGMTTTLQRRLDELDIDVDLGLEAVRALAIADLDIN